MPTDWQSPVAARPMLAAYTLSPLAVALGLLVATYIPPAFDPRAWFRDLDQAVAAVGAGAVLLASWASTAIILAARDRRGRLSVLSGVMLTLNAVAVSMPTAVPCATILW